MEKETEEKKENTKSSRRKFLVKTGKYALYASPVVIALLAPRQGVAIGTSAPSASMG